MTSFRYLLASLSHHRRVQLAVVAGVAVATAVITGALLVGDSVRGSLRDLTLERLGRIEWMLAAQQPFREQLAREFSELDLVKEVVRDQVAPLLLVRGSLGHTREDGKRVATDLGVIGYTSSFSEMGDGGPPGTLSGNDIAITRAVASELDVAVGGEVLLTLPLPSSIPSDSTLGERSETTTSRRLRVAALLPDAGLARFSLQPTQQRPRNVFVPLGTVQHLLDLQGRINAVALARPPGQMPSEDHRLESLQTELAPKLDDFQVKVDRPADRSDSDADYVRISSQELVLPTPLVEATQDAFPQVSIQRAITYLANTIRVADRQVPYSTITGIDSSPEIGPLLDDRGLPMVLSEDEVVLNDWAAGRLQARVGDEVIVTYYQPETTHGILREGDPLKLRLRAIAPLADEQGHATLAADPQLTPDLKGVTDQRSISDWDLPFELVEPIGAQDEAYWDEHSTTPKAFVAYGLAERLWKTRWGTDSMVRIPAGPGVTVEQVKRQVRPPPADMGMVLLPIRQQGLQAARGTTSFEGLFLGFSFFLMASAVMLVSLLFRLGVEGRAAEVGLLAAVGWSACQLRRLWLGEAAIVALIGTTIGGVAGIAYAWLMIHGLTTWWVAATVTPFLKLHVSRESLVLGLAIGLSVALLTIAWSLKKLLRLPARQLLAGDYTDRVDILGASNGGVHWIPLAMLIAALFLGGFAMQLEGESQAGAFFGSGAFVLAALLVGLRNWLRQPTYNAPTSLSLVGLAARTARRNPSRAILTVGLGAVASFLIVALSAFRLAPSDQGTGGFDLIATTDQPIHFDLDTAAGRKELGFGDHDNQQLTGTTIHGFRVHAGEDASCLNLYQTTQPRVLGIPKSFYDDNDFAWSAHGDFASKENPWNLLDTDLHEDAAGRTIVPVVLDKNTAAYSLHLGGIGSKLIVEDAFGKPVRLEVVGLLTGSVLQGNLLISEANFLRLFPDTAGQQFFLIRTPAGETTGNLATVLETRLQDYGLDVTRSRDKLEQFLAVQNTYLSTFQSLGALGLLLGACGLAVAQLRNVLERRGELALLRCTGFRRARLAGLVLGENVVLLLGGLGIGCLAALVAVLPHGLLQEATPPWKTLVLLLLTVAVTGVLAGWLAVRSALRAPLLPALRGD